MQNTTHYNLKKPDYTDFADIQDINDNMDTIDEQLAAPTGDGREQTVSFTDADLDTGITSFPTFLTKIVSGMKMAKFLRDFKAGMAYVLHVGSLVNNATCTESGKALDARMGKTLQDQITSLNDSLAKVSIYRQVSVASFTELDGIKDTNHMVLADVHSSTGAPSGNNRWLCLHFQSNDGTYGFQFAMSFSNANIYKRFKQATTSWSSWYQIIGTAMT